MREATRRDFLRLAGGAAAAAGGIGLSSMVSACGGSPSSGSSPPVKGNDVEKLYAAARKEGTLTWWTAQYELSAAEKLRDAFKAKYPGIQVQLLRQTAQVVYKRFQQDLKAGINEVDVFGTTDEAQMPTLKKGGALATYTPPDLAAVPKAFRHLDPDNQYQLGAVGFVVVNYQTGKVSAPPKSWKEFVDQKWQGKLTTGHPGFSGYVGNWVVAMLHKYGDDYLKELAKLNPKVNRSINDTVTDIVSGERVVGAGPDSYSLVKKSEGNPIDIKFPTDDAILIVAPSAIPAKAPHPNAARLFMNFTYSKEFNQTLVKTYNFPVRTDVPSATGLTIDKVKWYRNSVEQLSKGVPEAVSKWRQYLGV